MCDKKGGYITLETSIVIPICLFIFASILMFSIAYHDVVLARVDVENRILTEYFNANKSPVSETILFSPAIGITVQDGFMRKNIHARTFGKKGIIFHDFKVDANFSQSISIYKKKPLLRSLDVVDNIYSIFSDEDVRSKVGELKEKVKK